VNKFKTTIGDHVFVGTNSTLVAPAELADGAYIAAGSAITLPVGPGELAVARGRQRNIEGYVERKRPGSPAAGAAAAAKAAESVGSKTAEPGETNATNKEQGEAP